MVNSKYISNKYKTLVNSKKVINDEGQREAIEALDVLYSMVKSTFSIKNFFKKKRVMGVYIYGKVAVSYTHLTLPTTA